MLFIIASYTAFLIYLYMGFYVYKIDSKEKFNRLFMVMCILFAFCSLLEILKYNTHDDSATFFLTQLSQIIWLNYPGLLISISLILVRNDRLINNKYIKYGIYVPGILFNIYELFINNYSKRNSIISKIFWDVESIYIYLYIFISGLLLFQHYKKAKLPSEKKQAKILFFVGLITISMATFNDFVIAANNKFYLSMDQFIILIFFIAIWYMNSRYRFLRLFSYITAEDIVDKITDMVVLVDTEGIITGINTRAEEALGYKKSDLSGIHLRKIINLDFELILQMVKSQKYYLDQSEYFCTSINGNEIPINIKASAVKDKDGDILGIIIIFQDKTLIKKLKDEIDKRKSKEQQLNYLCYHDALTGLYNRTYFEQEMQKFQTETNTDYGIIIFDVDGLKFINDTLGHEMGDRLLIATANAIQSSLGNNAILSRIGGDEFAILVPHATKEKMVDICSKMRKAVNEHNLVNNQILLSISLGFALCNAKSNSTSELFKEADDNMYKEKLNHVQSARNAMVQVLMKTLEARDFIMEGHTDRMKELVIKLGEYIGLSEQCINDLQLLAQFHDLGKVGIPDNILFKPTFLTSDEKLQMQRHSEIGYRIAQSLPDLNTISSFILKHHERWDGKGYPLQICERNIPLECRILAIVDAYDAMMNDRPYRKAMTKKAAIRELKKHAGTQFDPQLVNTFIEMIGE